MPAVAPSNVDKDLFAKMAAALRRAKYHGAQGTANDMLEAYGIICAMCDALDKAGAR